MATTVAIRVNKLRRYMSRTSIQEAVEAYVLILPTIIGLLIFQAGPILASLYLSFTSWNLLSPATFEGLKTYRDLVQDPIFWISLRNTVQYMVGTVPAGTVLSLCLAMVLNQRNLRGLAIFRTVYFLPSVCSVVAISVLWRWLYQAEFGLINQLLAFVGIKGPPWLASVTWAMPAIIIMSIWHGLGYNVVIFLAGLQSISDEYYEAARIDGASAVQQFTHITIPLISPVTFFVIIMSVISSFQVFAQAYTMTQGGPVNATKTLVYYIYQQGFMYFRMGYASAQAWVLFIVVMIVTLIQFRGQKSWVHYEL